MGKERSLATVLVFKLIELNMYSYNDCIEPETKVHLYEICFILHICYENVICNIFCLLKRVILAKILYEFVTQNQFKYHI